MPGKESDHPDVKRVHAARIKCADERAVVAEIRLRPMVLEGTTARGLKEQEEVGKRNDDRSCLISPGSHQEAVARSSGATLR